MTLDDYWPPVEPREAPETPRRHRHWWRFRTLPPVDGIADAEWYCGHCNVIRDEAKARRGKSSRRLGHDGERRSEKRYGLQKIGERGEITDLRGKVWKAQQKTTRRAVPATWQSIFAQLDATRDGREAAIIFSFVQQGLPTQDFWLIRGETILSMLGRDDPEGA
jgi:hypothetical protein